MPGASLDQRETPEGLHRWKHPVPSPISRGLMPSLPTQTDSFDLKILHRTREKFAGFLHDVENKAN